MSALSDPDAPETTLREFAARLEGWSLDRVARPFGHSLYLRWESRGVKRSLEIQVALVEPIGIAVWATASKARRDRSIKIASLGSAPTPESLESALSDAVTWVDRWTVPDFFA